MTTQYYIFGNYIIRHACNSPYSRTQCLFLLHYLPKCCPTPSAQAFHVSFSLYGQNNTQPKALVESFFCDDKFQCQTPFGMQFRHLSAVPHLCWVINSCQMLVGHIPEIFDKIVSLAGTESPNHQPIKSVSR